VREGSGGEVVGQAYKLFTNKNHNSKVAPHLQTIGTASTKVEQIIEHNIKRFPQLINSRKEIRLQIFQTKIYHLNLIRISLLDAGGV